MGFLDFFKRPSPEPPKSSSQLRIIETYCYHPGRECFVTEYHVYLHVPGCRPLFQHLFPTLALAEEYCANYRKGGRGRVMKTYNV